MKPHPKIIDRIIESIRESRTFLRRRSYPPGWRLRRFPARPHPGPAERREEGLSAGMRIAFRRNTTFLDRDGIIQKPKRGLKFDCVIATDAASFERLGSVGRCVANRKLLINIDHHESNTRYGDLNWVSAREPSTGELIFRLLKVAKWPITKRIADSLFTAVSTDTGSFQYADHAPGHLSCRRANWCGAGLTWRRSAMRFISLIRSPRARLLRHIYSHFRLTHRIKSPTSGSRKPTSPAPEPSQRRREGLIDHIRAIAPVVVACVFEEMEPELTRISLRSKSEKVNVNEIAAQFGGGGHSAAAGARIPGSPLSVQRRVIAAVKKALDAAR